MIGQNINAYFKAAMAYPIERLHAVLRNEDKSIPAAAAMMALPLKEREMAAAKGRQATQTQQQQQPNVREKMAQEVAALPENTGIMNLPTQTEFAEGGIVAFDDGGYVPGYAAAGAVDAKLAGLQAEEARLVAQIAKDPDSPAAIKYLAGIRERIKTRQEILALDAPANDAGVAAIVDNKTKKVKKDKLFADTNPVPYGEVTPQNNLQQGFNFTVPPEQAVVPAAPPAPVVPAAPPAAAADANSAISGQGLRRDSMLPVPNRSYGQNIAKKEKDITAQGITDELAKINIDLQSMPPGPERTFLENRRDYLSGKVAPPNPLAAQNAEASKLGLGYLAAAKAGEAQAAQAAQAAPVVETKKGKTGQRQQGAGKMVADQNPEGEYKKYINLDEGAGSQAGGAGISDIHKLYGQLAGEGPDIEAKYKTATDQATAALKARNTEREAARPQEKAMAGFEKYLEKDEAAAKGKEDRNLRMSLVAAGLGIAGGKSQYALQNIAEGAQVGVKQYNAGLDKLEEAAKDREKLAMQIQEARRAEARGDWKEVEDRKDKIFDLQESYKLKGIEALAKITGENRKNTVDLWSVLTTNAARERISANEQRAATYRAMAGDRNALERTKIMAAGRTDIENVIRDNARQRASDWMRTGAGQMALAKDPNAGDIMFNKYLAEERAARQNQALLSSDLSAWGDKAKVTP